MSARRYEAMSRAFRVALAARVEGLGRALHTSEVLELAFGLQGFTLLERILMVYRVGVQDGERNAAPQVVMAVPAPPPWLLSQEEQARAATQPGPKEEPKGGPYA